MVRWPAIIGIFVLLAAAWLIFELQNIWPVNYAKVEVLRLMFALGAVGSIAAFTWGRSRLLPSALIAATFASTAVYSNSAMTPTYALMAAMIVVLVAALTVAVPRPENVR
ncbi:hypothetical protein [Sphingomonas guangdongensis]|nr:hypothetical protein [Sphingomonas guangdongensis]